MADFSCLKILGLNKTAIACYQSLFTDGGANTEDLVERINKPRTGLYRELHKLEKMGFIHSLKTTAQPTYYYAHKLEETLTRLAKYQRQAVKDLIDKNSS